MELQNSMIISTRTPEGDPLKCVVCGNEHLVLSSHPLGDSVCPTCGSHSWIATKKLEKKFPTAEVLQIVPTFVDKIRLSRSKMEMSTHLVDGLFQCLSPHGVTVWLLSPSVGVESMQFELAASRGETHSEDIVFANSNDGIANSLTINKILGERLLIRLPLKANNKLTAAGVLEVLQRTEIPLDARDESLKFVRSMAAISSGCRAFSNLEFV